MATASRFGQGVPEPARRLAQKLEQAWTTVTTALAVRVTSLEAHFVGTHPDEDFSVGRVYVGDGAAATPTVTFTSDTDTGMYLDATGSVALSTAGVERLQIGTTNANFAANVTVKSGGTTGTLTVNDVRVVEPYRIHLTRTTAFSVPTGGGGTTITWGTSESYVDHVNGNQTSFKGSTADSITVPVAGLYLVCFGGEFATNSTGIRQLLVTIGANTGNANELSDYIVKQPASATLPDRMRTSFVCRLDASATLTMKAYQNSGGALNLTNMSFSAVYLGA